MCKKQTSVTHSSTDSEIISLDAGLRIDGLLALDSWDVVIEVLRSSNSTKPPEITNPNPNKREPRFDQLSNVDYVTPNVNSSQGESQLYIFEDDDAVSK